MKRKKFEPSKAFQNFSRRLRLFLSVALSLNLLTQPLPARAAVPAIFNYQGKLADAGGSPQTGSFAMSFKVYDGGGATLYTYSRPSVPVANGVFSVLVGDISAPGATESPAGGLSAALGGVGNRLLGITVGAGPEMTPRQQLVAVPYALSIADGSVTNASVSPAAGIAYSKLDLSASVASGDLAGGVYSGVTGLGPQSQDLNMNFHRVTNLGLPAGIGDAAPKAYVDAATGTVSAITISAGGILSGGGNLTTNRTISLGLNNAAACTTAGCKVYWDGTQLVTGSDSGSSGVVTSVGLSMPGEFSVANSPVTSNGTLTVTKVSQAANSVYAAPSGAAGSPAFRTLVAADVPNLGAAPALTLGTANAAGTAATYVRTDATILAFDAAAPAALGTASAGVSTVAARRDHVHPAADLGTGSGLTGTLGVGRGGTGQTTLTQHGVMIGNAAGNVNVSTSGVTNDVFLSGGVGADPVWGRITDNQLEAGVFTGITGIGTQSQILNMNTHKITGVVDPTGAQDAATKAYVDAQVGASGSGTVTSAGLSMPAEFSVANSPVTTSGTLTVTKANQSANQIYAGPGSGVPASPTFRSLVLADLPSGVYGNATGLGSQGQILNMNTHKITGVVDPTAAQDAATKAYVDAQVIASGSGTVTSVGSGTGLSGGPITTSGTLSVLYGSTAGTAVQGNTSLTVSAGAGLSGGGAATLGAGGTLTLANADGGSAQNIFKNMANSAGTTQFSAGSNNDTIRFAGSGATTVSFTPATKTVTINSASGGSGTVTSVASGTGLTGGPITTSGTLSVLYGSTAGTAVQGNTQLTLSPGPGLSVTNTTQTLGLGGTWTVTNVDRGSTLLSQSNTWTGTPQNFQNVYIMNSSFGNTHFPFTDGWNYISGNGVVFRNSAMTEVARIDASVGRMSIGSTNTSPWGGLYAAGNSMTGFHGGLAVDNDSGDGVVWVDPNNPGTMMADLFRYSVDNNLYVTNDGLNNLTGVFLPSGGTSWVSTSDRRLKENIHDTTYGLADLLRLSVREYNFKNTKDRSKKIGLIAQEVYPIIPEIVHKGDDGADVPYGLGGSSNKSAAQTLARSRSSFTPWGVDYTALTPILIKAVQEQQQEIETLKKENDALKNRLDAVESKIGK